MNTLIIQNGRCITPFEIIDDSIVAVEGKRIVYVGHKSNYSIPSNAKIVDAAGQFISPGFIDIQINGGRGSDTLDGTPEAFNQIIDFHLQHGVTNLLLTLVSSPEEKMVGVLKAIREFKQRNSVGSFILGVHIEGPYISAAQIGAHNPKYLRNAEPEDFKQIFEFTDLIKLVTEAPEIPGVLDFCRELVKHGIIASIGHSNATFDEARKAVEAGFTMVTHIYSVMSSVRRIGLNKIAGVLEAALLLDELWAEVIGDGQHVPEPLLKLVLKNKGVNKTVLASDAIRAAGMQDGNYVLGDSVDNHQIIVDNGIAMTLDRKLYAGSLTTMDACVKNSMILGNVNIMEAVQMATINPARLLKIDHEIGSIEPGKKADIIFFDQDLNVSITIKDGNIIYQNEDSAISK